MNLTFISRKKYILISLLGIFISLFQLTAQTKKIELKGVIIDEGGITIPYASVSIVSKSRGTSSTEEGEFSLHVSNDELKDTLTISSLGFNSAKIQIEKFLNLKEKKIILKESAIMMDEVQLLSAKTYVINALKLLKDNTLSSPHVLEMLYRRATTEGGTSKFFVENYLKYLDKGPAYGLGRLQVTEARKSADYRVWKSKDWVHWVNYMAQLNPLRPVDSQHRRNLKKFSWKRTGNSSYEGEDVLIVTGQNPKIDWERITFYIGIDTHKIYKIERGRTLYLYKNHKSGKLVLNYFKHEWVLQDERIPKEYRNTIAKRTSYKVEGSVYNVHTEKDKRRIKDYGLDLDMGLLDLPYNAEFWNNLSLPPDTKFYKKIKSEIEGLYGVPLETQFKLVN
ncbi:carboxypeptidase-like regulatory domain-containing protein [uncultured Lutibacter sp.]|uniref:carboxypeptidase-like regulatory domain-containing protein n=1 Tax=uncultured Lutibacter sp. TaxID=437739 RepID=UPI0026089457|nr:carboxypeptidase-like regulatory domain-containing protein [uncultured Lutibacter sp.]